MIVGKLLEVLWALHHPLLRLAVLPGQDLVHDLPYS